MKKLKAMSIILAAVLASSALASCGTKTASSGEDPNVVPKDQYEINWYIQGTPQDDVASVEEAANEYLKDKINATLKIHRLESDQYKQQVTTMIQSGEYFDIAWCTEGTLDYKSNAKNGAWLQLDDYVDKYLSKSIGQIGSDIIDNVKVDGKLYTLPAYKEMAGQKGWTFRPDIAEKYNIDMNSIKSIDELEPVLLKIKAGEPNMQYPIDWGSDRTPVTLLNMHTLTDSIAIFYDKDEYKGKVVDLTENKEYLEACKSANRLYKDGLIKRDIQTASDFEQRVKDGKTFCYIDYLKPGKAKEASANYSFKLDQASVTPIYQESSAGMGSMMAVSRTSKNPERALRFLELLNTDEYLNNLINYGIEGKHYTKVSDKIVHIEPTTSYTMNGYQWMTGNIFINYLTDKEDPNKLVDMKAFNDKAEKTCDYGFSFDKTPVEMEIAACKTVSTQYRKQVIMGSQDPEAIMKEYHQKLVDAGQDKIVEEAQKQYTEFLNSHK